MTLWWQTSKIKLVLVDYLMDFLYFISNEFNLQTILSIGDVDVNKETTNDAATHFCGLVVAAGLTKV